MMNLVIVESGAKGKTIQNYLGKNFIVESCQGHFDDIKNIKYGPAGIPNLGWSYIDKKSQTLIKKIEKIIKSKKIKKIYAASDPDREGELIAERLEERLSKHAPVVRMTFQEITKKAVIESLERADSQGTIDRNLTTSAKIRKLADRDVGFRASRMAQFQLNKKTLGMGRVQTPTLGFAASREKEICKHKPEDYFEFRIEANSLTFKAVFEKPYKKNKHQTKSLKELQHIEKLIESKTPLIIKSESERSGQSSPPAPFSTDSFIQAAGGQGIPPAAAQSAAQKLYQNGFITYMRTDSNRINPAFQSQARSFIESNFSAQYLSSAKAVKKTKGKVQDAHEAIRPTGTIRNPKNLPEGTKRVYQIIWNRTIASEMAASKHKTTTWQASLGDVQFVASQKYITFPGYQHVYGKKVEEKSKIKINQDLPRFKHYKDSKKTKPPARYKEYTLIQKMKNTGIGRPSTYVSTIQTLAKHGYLEKKKGELKITPLGIDLHGIATIIGHYPGGLFNEGFTADFEQFLDHVESGRQKDPWDAFGSFRNSADGIFKLAYTKPTVKQTAYVVNLLDAWREKNNLDSCVKTYKQAKIEEENVNQAWSIVQSKDYSESKGICKKILLWDIAILLFGGFMHIRKDDINPLFDQETDQKMTEKQQNFIRKLIDQKIGGSDLLKSAFKEVGVKNIADLPRNNPIIKNLMALKNDPAKEPKITAKQEKTISNLSCGTAKNPDPCGVKAKWAQLSSDQLKEHVTKDILGVNKPTSSLTLGEASKIIGCLMTNLKRKRKKKDWKFDSGICK